MQDTQFAPLAGHRTRAGHWADRPAVDTRVSRAEQDDQMPAVGAPSLGDVLFLLAPIVLTLIGAGALLVSFIRSLP
jgi:hypothetical protein